ncbi:MAG: hypothetical protein O4806_14385 [Trichodesmium sp. St5_bin8]|nr:hypothetical protein [Trichodesmium sp. St5_bin8]
MKTLSFLCLIIQNFYLGDRYIIIGAIWYFINHYNEAIASL